MRFICDTNELNTALSIVSRALAVRSTCLLYTSDAADEL